jgi:hypothetical protein
VAVVGVIGVTIAWQTRDDRQRTPFEALAPEEAAPIHVHALGVNPADGTLFIATHTGLYRVAKDSRKADHVGVDRYQDTMGFTIAGPNHFLGSGHPGINEARERGLPPLLGLIESTDAGETWKPISLLGRADFHILRFAGSRVYGYDATNERLLTSADGGHSWRKLAKPGPLLDLVVSPSQPHRLVATAAGREQGLYESLDDGGHWKRLSRIVGVLAWPSPDRLYLVTGGGQVFKSPNGARRLQPAGNTGGDTAALAAEAGGDLYAALHDGTIKRSTDGGVGWTVRSTP